MHKKTDLHMRKQTQISRAVTSKCTADQRLCFCYTDSTIQLLLMSKFQAFSFTSFQLYAVTVQPCLCRTWSETRIFGFLMHRFILYKQWKWNKSHSFIMIYYKNQFSETTQIGNKTIKTKIKQNRTKKKIDHTKS